MALDPCRITDVQQGSFSRGRVSAESLFHLCCAGLSRFSRVRLFATLQTVALQASLSMGFPRQGYWRGLPCPPPGDLPDPAIKPMSLMSPALASGFFTTSHLGSPEDHYRFDHTSRPFKTFLFSIH